MKRIITVFLFVSIISIYLGIDIAAAENIKNLAGELQGTSISGNTNVGGAVEDIGFRIINIVRYIFSAILVLIIIYFGAKMIMSMGNNEESISSAKKGILYALIGIIFINFPVAIYNAIIGGDTNGNFLINEAFFTNIIYQIISFLEIIVVGIAIIMLILAGIRLITSRGRDEKISEVKNKVLWTIVALVFIGFIEAYKRIIIAAEGRINFGEVTDIFKAAASLLLYMVGPIIILFLTIAGYYYITSNGNEDRVKKGKSIVINTIIGIILLLCCYIVLNDISLLIN